MTSSRPNSEWLRFGLERRAVALARVGLLGTSLIGLLGICLVPVGLSDPRLAAWLSFDSGPLHGMMLWAVAVGNALGSFKFLRELIPPAVRPETAGVEVSSTSIRNVGGPALPWDEVDAVVPRGIFRRLDIKGRSRDTVVRLDLGTEQFSRASELVLGNLPPMPVPERELRRWLWGYHLLALPVLGGAIALSFWLGTYFAVVSLLVLLPGYWLDTRNRLKAIEVSPERLRLALAFRQIELPRESIRDTGVVFGSSCRLRLLTDEALYQYDVPARHIVAVYLAILHRWGLKPKCARSRE